MYDENTVLRRLQLHFVHYDYDICLLTLLKHIVIYDSLTNRRN